MKNKISLLGSQDFYCMQKCRLCSAVTACFLKLASTFGIEMSSIKGGKKKSSWQTLMYGSSIYTAHCWIPFFFSFFFLNLYARNKT